MRRNKVVAIVAVIVAVILLVIVLLTQFVLAETSTERPVAPPAVAALRSEWRPVIMLPNFLPACLEYDPNGARIEDDPEAEGGKSLVVGLIAPDTPECREAANANVVIRQAPALQSLRGAVTTITEGRMQFARVARVGDNGQNEVTLQWHCRTRLICRLTGTTGPLITEDTLAKMANSFAIIRTES